MTPKKAYNDLKHHSVARGIEFLLSYEQFLEMWLISGKWRERGKTKGSYQMCRNGDTGPYSIRNCYIGTVEENQKERHNVQDDETNAILYYYLVGWTQRAIGDKFGITQSAVSKIVNGKRRAC